MSFIVKYFKTGIKSFSGFSVGLRRTVVDGCDPGRERSTEGTGNQTLSSSWETCF